MSVAVIALATALIAPKADMPLVVQLEKKIEAAHLKTPLYRLVVLDISPDGMVIGCTAGDGKGDAESLEKVCPLALELRYQLTAKIDGQPAYGRTRTIITAFDTPADRPQVKIPPALVLHVDTLPDRMKDGLNVSVNFVVSQRGSVDRCEPAGDKYRDYAKLACMQIIGKPAPVMKDRQGVSIAYVDFAGIRLVADGASSASVN